MYTVMPKLGRAGDDHMTEMSALARASANAPEGLSGFEPPQHCHTTGFAGYGDIHISGNMATCLLCGVETCFF
jgi:hypothetical protein